MNLTTTSFIFFQPPHDPKMHCACGNHEQLRYRLLHHSHKKRNSLETNNSRLFFFFFFFFFIFKHRVQSRTPLQKQKQKQINKKAKAKGLEFIIPQIIYRFEIFSAISIFSNTKDLFRIDLDPRRQSNIDLNKAKLTFVRNHDDTIDLFVNFLFIDISSANRE